MAKTISVVNMKGGVGKSTLAVQLSYTYALEREKVKVLLCDLDPQFNSSQHMLGAAKYKSEIIDNNGPTMWNIFEQYAHVPGLSAPKPIDTNSVIYNIMKFEDGSLVDLIPSRLDLAFSMRNPSQKEELLSRALKKVESDYSLIFIDCPPTESVFTTAAYFASDYLLVPVKPEYLSSIGLPLLANSLAEFSNQYQRKAPEVAGVIFNFTTEYSPEEITAKKEVREVAREYKWHVFDNEVPYSRSIAKSAREGKPLPWTSYSRYSQYQKLIRVAKELQTQIS